MSKNENNLAFAPKSADDLNEQKRESDVLIAALEKCEKLEEENNKLKQVISEAGIIKCCKCGEYHHRNYVCWHCGYDYTAPKELDK